uniref:F-box domain-containing protein n=1 Tax=Aegilops tauschii subsp. strangulata TaxID=200361 RepID=A0A453MUC6_AEGTS
MGNYLTSTRTTREKRVHVKPATGSTNGKGRPNIKLQDLPEDVLCTILSKLPAKEVVWTSALASEWESLWTTCPRLRRCLVLWLVTQTLMVTGHAGGSKG